MERTNYSLWPILLMSFFVSVAGTLIGFGLPNYFLYDLGNGPVLAALTITFFAVPYAVMPLVFAKYSERIGKRKTIMVSAILCVTLAFLYLFPLTVIGFFIVRFLDGGVTGWFWSILEASIPETASIRNNIQDRISKYNISWNLAAILAFALAAIAVFIIHNNYIVFILAVIAIIFTLPAAFALKLNPESENQGSDNSFKNIAPIEIVISPRKESTPLQKAELIKSDQHKPYFAKVPLLIPLLAVASFGGMINTMPMLISIKYEILGIAAYWTYVLSFARSSASGIFSKVFEKIDYGKYIRWIVIMGILQGVICILLIPTANLAIYFCLMLIYGGASVVLYRMPLKMILDRNSAKNTVLYSCIFQAVLGIISAVFPLLAGYGSEHNLKLTIGVLGLVSIVISVAIAQVKLPQVP